MGWVLGRQGAGKESRIDLRGLGPSALKFNKLTSVFYASVLLLIMNFVITLSK